MRNSRKDMPRAYSGLQAKRMPRNHPFDHENKGVYWIAGTPAMVACIGLEEN